MGRKYTWAFIDTNAAATATSAEGQKGSIQYNDPADEGTFTGSSKLIFDASAETLMLTGSLSASGDIIASNYFVENIIVQDRTGSTRSGDSNGDFHQFTGSLEITGDGPHEIASGQLLVTAGSNLRVEGTSAFIDSVNFNGDVNLGNLPADDIAVKGLARFGEHASTPSAPADGEGGYFYTKADGKPYWISNELSETDLSQFSGELTISDSTLYAQTDISDPTNYHVYLHHDSATTGRGPGIAFSTATDTDDVGAAIVFERTDSESEGSLQFYTKQNTDDAGTPTLVLELKEDGFSEFANKVGIGGITPSYMLDVDGDVRIRGNDIRDNSGNSAITFDGSANTEVNGTLTVSGGDLDVTSGGLTISGDLTVSGGDINGPTDDILRIKSDLGVIVELDNDNDGVQKFIIRNGDDDNIFEVEEPDGAITVGGTISGPTDGNLTLSSDQNVYIRLDEDSNETNRTFNIVSSAGNNNFVVNESGDVSLSGTLTGPADNNFDIISDHSITMQIDADGGSSSQFKIVDTSNTTVFSVTETGLTTMESHLKIGGSEIRDSGNNAVFSFDGQGRLDSNLVVQKGVAQLNLISTSNESQVIMYGRGSSMGSGANIGAVRFYGTEDEGTGNSAQIAYMVCETVSSNFDYASDWGSVLKFAVGLDGQSGVSDGRDECFFISGESGTQGRVGIGKMEPEELLHIDGDEGDTRIRLETTDGNDLVYTGYQGTTQKMSVGYDDSVDYVVLSYGGMANQNMAIGSTGQTIFERHGGSNNDNIPTVKINGDTSKSANFGILHVNNADTNMEANDVILRLSTADSTVGDNMYWMAMYDCSVICTRVGGIDNEILLDPFTGGHPTDILPDKLVGIKQGMIVKSTGEVFHRQGISNAWCRTEGTTVAKDKAVVGVYNRPDSRGSTRTLEDGTEEIVEPTPEGRQYHLYNAVGEGQILVTDEGGNIETGDYICSSNRFGHGMLQDDDLLHNYTVAKATEPIDFSTIDVDPELGFKSVLVACTYHCG